MGLCSLCLQPRASVPWLAGACMPYRTMWPCPLAVAAELPLGGGLYRCVTLGPGCISPGLQDRCVCDPKFGDSLSWVPPASLSSLSLPSPSPMALPLLSPPLSPTRCAALQGGQAFRMGRPWELCRTRGGAGIPRSGLHCFPQQRRWDYNSVFILFHRGGPGHRGLGCLMS